MRSRGLKWTRIVARVRELINAYNILFGIPEGKDRLGDINVDCRRILLGMGHKATGDIVNT
jgi:hypothetical protein